MRDHPPLSCQAKNKHDKGLMTDQGPLRPQGSRNI